MLLCFNRGMYIHPSKVAIYGYNNDMIYVKVNDIVITYSYTIYIAYYNHEREKKAINISK